ncbi:rhodanese-like domain-containing protein [Parendozoicomonas sp. Alg238-R29]|uniref:rhodanese-like domain-containing protein n=1 Tax=Parendozoicomonas sp. Alg238-R29 TaxID=2993446 RepID=UPI00248D415C|nr:rhodanese-like domain-containing protein [Parendozoicomonas sp. Alg238-R29]
MSYRNTWMVFGVLVSWFGFANIVNAKEAPESINGADTITTTQAQELFRSGATFIDVRTRQKWQWGHIQGAHHFDLRSTFGLLRHPGFIKKDHPVVIYSNGPHTMRGALASYMATSWGYENVYFYRDGYFSWLATDLPINIAPQSSALEAAIMQSAPRR